jgi:hypothetical protein
MSTFDDIFRGSAFPALHDGQGTTGTITNRAGISFTSVPMLFTSDGTDMATGDGRVDVERGTVTVDPSDATVTAWTAHLDDVFAVGGTTYAATRIVRTVPVVVVDVAAVRRDRLGAAALRGRI